MKRSEAKAELVSHLKVLRAFALSLARDRTLADDLVQETVMRAWANMHQFQEGSNMRAWLFTILRNEFYATRRKAGREVGDPDGDHTGSLATKSTTEARLHLHDFRKAFDKLPAEQREVLVLVGALQHSYEEAAEMCGVKIGTIKSRLNRGREALAVEMKLAPGERLDLTDAVTQGVLSRQPMPSR